MEYSVSPDGEKFKLPDEKDYQQEYERLKGLVDRQRKEGREIVVVMGLGFVGAVMAGVVADSVDKGTGKSKNLSLVCRGPAREASGRYLCSTGDCHPLRPKILMSPQ